jgi:D-inositol-3-phosphate glycosyltransferase
MHIALVHRDLHEVTRGGVCTVYRALAQQLLDRGHSVTLITQETQSPVRLPGAAVAMLPRTDDLASHGRAVTAALAAFRPDVAECSSWEFELLDYARTPRRNRAPVLVRGDLTARTMGATELARGEAELVALADGVVAVSRYARDDLASAYGVEATVVPNGVDRRRFGSSADWRPPASGVRVKLTFTLQSLGEAGLKRVTVALSSGPGKAVPLRIGDPDQEEVRGRAVGGAGWLLALYDRRGDREPGRGRQDR